MARSLLTCCSIVIALAACGDGGDPTVKVTDAALTDAHDAAQSDSGTDGAIDTVEADILYPGYLCIEDESCSTGLCYGTATSQGFFEPAKCQTRCLEVFDYLHYCDSDDDCCRGKCCVNCGPQEGLCVLP